MHIARRKPSVPAGGITQLAHTSEPQSIIWAVRNDGTLLGFTYEREQEVLRLLATDLSGPEIARRLVLSLNTVRTHTKNVYAKLGVSSRRAAVRRAEELGL